MKIREVKTNLVRLPLDEPIVGAPPMPGMLRDFVTVQVMTDDGIEGIGFTGFGGKIVKTLKTAVEEFGELIKGADPLAVDLVAAQLHAAAHSNGPGGIVSLALAAIDIALWDIRGKAFGVPVATLLGAARDTVPAYASGALVRTTPLPALEKAAAALVKKGYTQMKTQMAVEGLNVRAGDRAHPRRARGRRSRGQPDGRHQPALGRARGDFHRPPDRGLEALLARRPNRRRRLSGPRRDRPRARYAGLRRRISLRHCPAPADAWRITRSISS